MKYQKLCLLLLVIFYFSMCSAKLLGPEAKSKQSDEEENQIEDSSEAIESNDQIDAEYMKDLKKVVNLQLQLQELKDYMAAVRQAKKATLKAQKELAGMKDDSEPEETVTNFLEEIKDMKKMVDDIKPGWLESVIQLSQNKIEVAEENPQEILDALPPLPHDEETDLTPEELQAKELYETAMTKLSRRPPDVRAAILQVKEAADKGYVPARIKIAWCHLFGEGVEMDVEKTRAIFEELAQTGNADAHAGLGFMYAMGFSVPVNQAKALVHYTMGALGDSTFAQMALAYRYWAGVTVSNSCPKALDLYQRVAAKVAGSVSLSGGPAVQRVRLLDEAEGAGAGGALDTDLIEYYQLLAEKGDVQAQVGLGQLHFQGGRGVTLDINKALHYFQQAAKTGNAVANAFLGKIYLEGGDGIKADNETALRYFRKAAELNNPVGQSGLGFMYLQGRVVPKDTSTAFKYFTLAANQGWVEGQLHLGFMYFGGIGVRRDFKQANKYFSLASQSGHVLAFYHLAQMHAQGLGVVRSCTTAVELFKNVCERGKWGERLMLAHAAWRAKDADRAFLQYSSMAEAGYELAQSNAAYLLDTGEVQLFNESERWARALQLWSRAASQGYSPARVKLGDYHYYGLGTSVDYETSAYHYRIAAEQQLNAQATFNLGYMHELGLGLAQDLHLAKRCYDLATHMSPDARLPATLALAKLNMMMALNGFKDSPLGLIFLTGESFFLANWDLYFISMLLGALGLVIYFRRPRPQAA